MKYNKTPLSMPEQLSLFDFAPDTDDALPIIDHKHYSQYVVYVDESGDHSMDSIDDSYPIFVLSFCVFHKRHYCERVTPYFQKFKFNHYGHDRIILHESDIRKQRGAFANLQNRQQREDFLAQLTHIIDKSNFILISCVIDKRSLKKSESSAENPYHIALGFCLETLFELMQEKNQAEKHTHVIVECRGQKEDKELELEFRRICDVNNRMQKNLPFEVIFADKKENSIGLQLADLVSRPVGIHYLRPEQPNRAFDALKRKFYCEGGRTCLGVDFESFGLKIFPTPKSEKPR
jgi:hypothetical protein